MDARSVLREMACSTDKRLKMKLATYSLDEDLHDIYVTLSQDKVKHIRERIARNTSVPPWLLLQISKTNHGSVWIRNNLARNEKTPLEALQIIVKDITKATENQNGWRYHDVYILQHIIKNPNVNEKLISDIVNYVRIVKTQRELEAIIAQIIRSKVVSKEYMLNFIPESLASSFWNCRSALNHKWTPIPMIIEELSNLTKTINFASWSSNDEKKLVLFVKKITTITTNRRKWVKQISEEVLQKLLFAPNGLITNCAATLVERKRQLETA